MAKDHIPVLLKESIDCLAIQPSGIYIDATAGSGGHDKAILEQLGDNGRLIVVDASEIAVEGLKKEFFFEDRIIVQRSNFADLRKIVADLDLKSVSGILIDLGASTRQLTAPEEGFTFSSPAPLDMRYYKEPWKTDRRRQKKLHKLGRKNRLYQLRKRFGNKLTAEIIVNHASTETLQDIIQTFGEEKETREIVEAIDQARKTAPITDTQKLAALIAAVKKEQGKLHPATRTFQALRIAVNNELENLEAALIAAVDILAPNGRLVVISFHSLEDRIVKKFFNTRAKGCICPPKAPTCVCGQTPDLEIITKKPIQPTKEETKINPRSRSAKLRCAQKI